MKALGLTMMDRVAYLAQLGVITQDERIEYAGIIQVAMARQHERFYNLLRNKLHAKTQCCPEEYLDALDEAICLIPQF